MSEENSGQWQPIETAPKDGTEVLTFNRTLGIIVAACKKEWVDTWDGHKLYGEFTHWMPLPEPPLEAK